MLEFIKDKNGKEKVRLTLKLISNDPEFNGKVDVIEMNKIAWDSILKLPI